MTFTDRTVSHAYATAKGQCERCRAKLNLNLRGTQWQAHHRISFDDGGSDEPENCEILCAKCYDAASK